MTTDEGLAAAQRAIEANDLQLALAAWHGVRAAHPMHPTAYTRAASKLMQSNRAADAEALLAQAPIALLGDAGFAMEWAWAAHHRKDFATAARRWRCMQALFPDNPLGFSGLAVSLREAAQFAEAEQVLETTQQRFPKAVSPAVEYAMLATLQKDWPEALRRWERLRRHFPDEIRGYTGAAGILQEVGQEIAADAMLREAMARFPSNISPFIRHAEAAEAKQDWKAAVERWVTALARDPGNGWIGHKLGVARMRLAETDPDDTPETAPAELMRFAGTDLSIPDAERAEMFALMMQFESLGSGRGGCEFGGVQRRFGAEPLGLLRWSEARPDKLISALQNSFEGVGQPENTIMYPSSDRPTAEYITVDKRYGMLTHTFALVKETDRDQFYVGACRRLRFLKDKLLEDLTEARKIFIYKIDGVEMSDEDVLRVHASLCLHGSNSLVCVRLADGAHPDGTVQQIAPRVVIGYVRRFAGARPDGGWDEPLPSWTTICRRAAQLLQVDNA